MPDANEPLLVLAVPAWDELRRAYQGWDLTEVEALLKERLDKLPNPPSLPGRTNLTTEFKVIALPSNVPIPVWA